MKPNSLETFDSNRPINPKSIDCRKTEQFVEQPRPGIDLSKREEGGKKLPVFRRTGHRILQKNAPLMDALFRRLLERAASTLVTARVSSPSIASRCHQSLVRFRGSLQKSTWPSWIVLPARAAPFPPKQSR